MRKVVGAVICQPPRGLMGLPACCAPQGRMIDHLRNSQSVGLEYLQALVLDEADRLLEMGFSEEVRVAPRFRVRPRVATPCW
jgi:DEAD/DEAH box helicase